MDSVKSAQLGKLQREIVQINVCKPLKIWQRKLCNWLNDDANRSSRRICWFWEDKGNVGKSYLTNYLCMAHDWIQIDKARKPDMVECLWNEYTDKTARARRFVIDLCRDQKQDDRSSWGALPALIEQLLNDAPIKRSKYTGDRMTFGPAPPMIAVFANSPPPDEGLLWSADRTDNSTWNIRNTAFHKEFGITWRSDQVLEQPGDVDDNAQMLSSPITDPDVLDIINQVEEDRESMNDQDWLDSKDGIFKPNQHNRWPNIFTDPETGLTSNGMNIW